MELKYSGKLSAEDIEDVGRLVRSRWYWPRLLLANWYGVLLLLVLIGVTVLGLITGARLNWRGIGIVWAIVALILLYSHLRIKRQRAKEVAQLDASLPDWITLRPDGLHFDGPRGARSFQPWSSFNGWREGERTVVIDYTAHKGFAMLAVYRLSEGERQVLRGALSSHLISSAEK
jgi:hypothetical protein